MKILCAFLLSISFCGAATRDELWKQVDEHISKDLPKSAITVLEQIDASARAEKAWAEAIRATAQRIRLQGQIDEAQNPVGSLVLMQKTIVDCPAEMKPMLDVIQSLWLWSHYQQNEWRFRQRTQVAEQVTDDIKTWDLRRILVEIDAGFGRALAQSDSLKAIPVADFDRLYAKGTLNDNLRPTVYDLVARNVLEFYASEQNSGVQAEDVFSFSAESPAFGTTAEFLAWVPQGSDQTSPKRKAIALWQDLLRFHQERPIAQIQVNLDRLDWARGAMEGGDATALIEKRLREWETSSAGLDIQAMVRVKLATWLVEQKRMKEALVVAEAGSETGNDKIFQSLCATLVDQIRAPGITVSSEPVWNAAKPEFSVEYRNVTRLWLRLYPGDWKNPNNYYDEKEWQKLLSRKVVREWSVELPATEDFLPRQQELLAQWDLPYGVYSLVVSANEKFTLEKNCLNRAEITISDLALVQEQSAQEARGFVLHAISGKPMEGAVVERWVSRENLWLKDSEVNTNAEGRYQFPKVKNGNFVYRAKLKNDAILGAGGYAYSRSVDKPIQKIHLFTDRAIYRPGQTVRFKGIATYYDRTKNDYHTVTDKEFTVVFKDANNKEIAQSKFRSNGFGSFQGSFTAPTDRVLGRAYLQCSNDTVQLLVEEYKRPKFSVEVGTAKAPPRLGEKVTVVAKATAYTGAAIDGAKVKWHVTRQARWPIWARYCWWFGSMPNDAKQIAHGTAVTTANGEVEITFVAEADPSVDPKTEPIFQYNVVVDVTDGSGESRNGSRSVSASYVDLAATLSADPWLDAAAPVILRISTRSIDDVPMAAKGTIAIHRLQEPEKVLRSKQLRGGYRGSTPSNKKDPSDPNSWELGELVQKIDFSTDAEGGGQSEVKLLAGEYRAVLETTDSTGKKVTALLPLRVIDPNSTAFPTKIAHDFSAKSWTLEPGQEFLAAWGTGYEKGQFYYEIEHRGVIVQSGWSDGNNTQQLIRFAVKEEHRGGFAIRTLFQKENRTYVTNRRVDVPWSQKKLSLRFENMRNRLEPGAKETWTVVIEGAEKDAVEMLGAMYDASLDAFAPHYWQQSLSSYFYRNGSNRQWRSNDSSLHFQQWVATWYTLRSAETATYRALADELLYQQYGWGDGAGGGFGGRSEGVRMLRKGAPNDMLAASAPMESMESVAFGGASVTTGYRSGEAAIFRDSIDAILNNPEGATKPGDAPVAVRKNLQETAFFEPQLLTDEKGVVSMSFTMPEALTKWRFMGIAHDKALRSGFIEGTTVTAKDLMVQPNPPRFLREGDEIEFTAKVSNQSDKEQVGKVSIDFADAVTLESRNAALQLSANEQAITVPAKESRTVSWRIKVPDGAGFLTFKVIARCGVLSDGEEGMIPVLSRRQLVTESITLPIRDVGSRSFAMKKLIESGKSDTLKHQSLSLQIVSQPAWYAVMALPYLMEYPHECAEQTFNRYYANQLARHIVKSDPKIRRVFEVWRTAPQTLKSPLLQNQDLKSLMIEETPWLRDANSETEARRNVGVLFDENRLDSEMARASKRLADLQLANGAWPWFPGGKGSEFITLYIVTGQARLKHLGATEDTKMSLRALDWLDAQIEERYRAIKVKDHDANHYSSFIAMYLYARSFYLEQRPIAKKNQSAVDYFVKQGAKYWNEEKSLMTRCHTALALTRFGSNEAPAAIVASLRENALNTDEMGMHWRMNENYFWYQAPIETQSMIIETFREVAKDMKAVDDCQVWLLKQKHTQGWKTTKSTADAIYALLLGGDVKRLASDALVTAELGGVAVKPENVEAGTGYYEKKFSAAEVKASMGEVVLTKTDKGVSWGSLHWQYLEDVSKITPHEGNPLEVKKSLFLKRMTKAGAEIVPVTGPLSPGDELVTRVEIRVDRDMEYVHLKNQRGSGLEPTNVLSTYKYQDGLGYYEMTKDTADHFFIEYLRRGTYVFETSARVQLRGAYPSGIAEIQCMYAPEFNSHSGSVMIEVK